MEEKNITIALLSKNQDSFAGLFQEEFEKNGVRPSFIYPHTGIAAKAIAKMRPYEPSLLIVDTASLTDISDFLQEIKKEIFCKIWTHSGHPINEDDGVIHIANETILEKEIKDLIASL